MQVTESGRRTKDPLKSRGLERTHLWAERTHLWAIAVPLVIYGVSRLVSATFLVTGAARQAELVDGPQHYVWKTIPASPGYWGVLANWDGQWYKTIAIVGYPQVLPVSGGEVERNAWAFYPLFPTLSRLVMRLTGLPFEVAGGLVSLVAGAVAVVLLHLMLRRRMSAFASAATIAALCAFPTAAILQVAYSESVSLLVLVLTIWALHTRRYGVFSGLAVVLSLTRPIAPALLLVVVVHWLARWRQEGVPRTAQGWFRPIVTLAVTGVSAFAWPAIAWLATGERDAFFLTQDAWKQTTTDDSYMSRTFVAAALDSPGRLLLWAVVPLAFFVFMALRPVARRWGLELRAWVAVYPAYILLATQPTGSVVRYLMFALVPFWPFLTAGERPDEPRLRKVLEWAGLALLLTVELLIQKAWVLSLFTVDVGPSHQGFP